MNKYSRQNVTYYYDENNEIISRVPTHSNMLETGSDNSLYFGLLTNVKDQKLLEFVLSEEDITDINNRVFEFDFEGQTVPVEFHINRQNQLQFKIGREGLRMFHLKQEFERIHGIITEEFVIQLDFLNREITFRIVSDF